MVRGSGAADSEWAACWRAERELHGPRFTASGPVEQANLGAVGMRVRDWKAHDKQKYARLPEKEIGAFQKVKAQQLEKTKKKLNDLSVYKTLFSILNS